MRAITFVMVFEGYDIYKTFDGFFEIGLKGGEETTLTGASSKLLSVLKYIILEQKWKKQ